MWRSFAEHWHVEHCWSSEQSQYSRLLNLTQMNNSSGSLQDSPIKDLLKLFRSHVYLASCVCPFGLSVLGLSCSQSHVYRPSSEWEASIFTAFREAVISILTQRLGFCVSVFTAVIFLKHFLAHLSPCVRATIFFLLHFIYLILSVSVICFFTSFLFPWSPSR